jgi:galactose mutarotase-like enzyme
MIFRKLPVGTSSLITIASPDLSADINPLGAQLSALRDHAGRDLQWDGDPEVWKGRAPILFPIVGALSGNQYNLDGKVFKLSRHGFARDKLFSLVEATPASALFRLRWDEETLAVYPFEFELDLRFSLEGPRLHILASVRNLEDEKIMPASFGFHPALRWPLPYGEPRAAHALTFEKDEAAAVRRLDSQGLVVPEEFATPVVNRKLQLRDDLFTADAIIFDHVASRKLRYGADQGPYIEIAFPAMPQLGIWTKPGAGFICIEPWHGFADPQGYSGDFRAKPGMALLQPGTAKEFAMAISLMAAEAIK